MRLTLTKGNSVENAGGSAGAASGVNDHDAIVTEWHDEQLQVKPRSPDNEDLAVSTGADRVFTSPPVTLVRDPFDAGLPSEAQTIPLPA